MNKKIIFSFVVFLSISMFISAFISSFAFAQTLAGRTSPRRMEGIRPLGMGGAFIAADGEDENALFYNPAAINDFEDKIHMQFVLPTVKTSYKAINFIASDILNLADDIDAAATDSAKVDVFDAFAATNTGRYEEVGLQGSLVNFMYKWLAASIFYDTYSVIALTNPASNTIDVEAVSHMGLQLGSAYSFFEDQLQVGLAVKVLERHFVDETITQRAILASATFDDIFDFNRFGFGVGVDFGVKGRLPINAKWWKDLDPVFAATVQDIGHTRFTNDTGRSQQSATAGLAIHPNFWKFKNQFVVDVRDLEYQSDIINKLHAGFELSLPEISKVLRSFAVRVGLNQGYFAAGFGLDFKYFKLNAATWGREVAERSSYQKQSRMYGVQFAAGF